MRTGSTRREFLGAVATAPAVGALSGRASSESAGVIQTGDEWPEFGYDAANTGHNPGGTGPVEEIGGLWRSQLDGRATAQPAVADGVVYLASQDGRVYAFDTESGESRAGWPVELDGPTGCPPAVVDGTLYVGDSTGTIHAIDTESGETAWRFGTEGTAETAPTVVDGTVYVTSSDGVYAIEPAGAAGEVAAQWSYTLPDDDNRTITTAPAVATIDTETGTEQFVYVGLDSSSEENGAIIALNGGERAWVVAARGPVLSAPAVADGWVYAGGGVEGNPQEGALYKIDAASGDPQGERPVSTPGWVVSSPTVTAETVYVGTRSGQLVAFDTATGAQKWSFDTGLRISSSPAVVDGTVYVTSESSFAYAVDPDGEEVWSFQTSSSQLASPAVANGVVYVPSVDSTEQSTLYALGEGGEIESGAPLGDDGTEEVDGSVIENDDPQSDYAFLVVPAAVGGFFTLIAAVGYAIIRSGVPERFEVDEAPVERLYDDEEEIPGNSGRSQSAVWSAVVGDVISRAEQSEKAATENVIVTNYIDNTLDSPVVAYEIESARDEPARVTVTAPFVDEERAETLGDQPLNEGWTIGEETLRFETVLGAGETVKTMVGRQDCPDDRTDELLTKPDVSVEPLEN